ncbi:MAG: phosphoribosylformylglycinamidine synthase subunit PurS [Elusimicrobiota bacterium]
MKKGDCVSEYKILIKYKDNIFDAEGEKIKKDILNLGFEGISSIKTAQMYKITGDISFEEVKDISENLLLDPITQLLFINSESKHNGCMVEVFYKYGVTDSVAETVNLGIKDINIKKNLDIKTGKKYFLQGKIQENKIKIIIEKSIVNTLIQEYRIIYGS